MFIIFYTLTPFLLCVRKVNRKRLQMKKVCLSRCTIEMMPVFTPNLLLLYHFAFRPRICRSISFERLTFYPKAPLALSSQGCHIFCFLQLYISNPQKLTCTQCHNIFKGKMIYFKCLLCLSFIPVFCMGNAGNRTISSLSEIYINNGM